MSSKEMRAKIIGSGSPLRKHSLNQESLKRDKEGQSRVFGNDSKAEIAYERRRRQKEEFKEFVEDYIDKGNNRTMSPRQLRDYRKGLLPSESLRHLFNGNPTLDDIFNIVEHEHVTETFSSEKETKMTVVFVDAPHRTGIKKSKQSL